MIRTAKLTLMMLMVSSFGAYAQLDVPVPSPKGSVYSKVGLTDVTIDYYRPKVKGRKIFGGEDALIPYGKTWRTGANSGSKLTISTYVKVGGKDVAKGEYLILTVPGEKEWSFILYNDTKLGGNMNNYKQEDEALKVTATVSKLAKSVETMTFNISDISEDNTKASIELTWANVSVKVPLEVSFKEEVMSEIKEKTQIDPRVYAQAANFYLDQKEDLAQALEWVNLYLADESRAKHFWHVHTKAKILAAMGNKKEAKQVAKESMELAKNNPNGDFGYVKRNEDLIKSL